MLALFAVRKNKKGETKNWLSLFYLWLPECRYSRAWSFAFLV
jgi:hypothetical protein